MMRDNAGLAAIQRQIMWNRLIAVVEEQAQTMIRTAFSTTVREAGDLSAGIFDLQGRMLAQAVTGTPGHVNSMMESVGHFLAQIPGRDDAAGRPLHHQRSLARHRPSARPHRRDARPSTAASIVGLFANTAHVIDVGGLGMGPEGRSVFEEGHLHPDRQMLRRGRGRTRPSSTSSAPARACRSSSRATSTRSAPATTPARGGSSQMMDEFAHGRASTARRASSSSSSRAPRWPRSPSCRAGTYRGRDRLRRLRGRRCTLRAAMTIARRTRSRSISPAPRACPRAASTCRPPIAAPMPASASRCVVAPGDPEQLGEPRAVPHDASRRAASSTRRGPIRSRCATSSASCCPT